MVEVGVGGGGGGGADVPAELTDFPDLVHVKSWKKPWKGLFCGQRERTGGEAV